jgi:hypothetical protein
MNTATSVLPLLARVDRDGLLWSRGGPFSSEHRLDAGDQRVATLRFVGRFRRSAVAECGAAHWRLERPSVWSGVIRIVDADTGELVGLFRRRFLGGGTLELENGNRYRWRRFGLWVARWGFEREQGGDPLVTFRSRVTLFQTRDEVAIDADARRLPELPLLLVLGRYLNVRRRRRAA